jgi:PAB1-binding protein PBP1
MAFSISSNTFFTWVNKSLDKIIQNGGGRTRTPSSSVQRVVSRIYDAGFTRKITDRYSLLTDEMLDDYHDNLFAIGVLKTYIAQFPYSNTIEETLRNFTKLRVFSLESANNIDSFKKHIANSTIGNFDISVIQNQIV